MGIDEHSATLAAGSVSTERPVLGARYEILALLGSGGMGNVYRARDLELDELVALKVLKPQVVSAPGALERFRREVKLARRVTHPNVARVFDIGEHGGDRILTMELVDGESLAAAIRREVRMPLARVVEIVRAICAGVGAAHTAGVVHRDLKPDNVLLAKDGRVVVTDFGIARAAAEGTRTVGFVGTPAYMAPEQIDERATIDHRVDIYALGAVMYELFTGEAAWQAESLWALAAARLLQPPPDPRERRPDLPPPLAALAIACMARDADARPPSMTEIDRRLSEIALPEPSTTPAPPRPERGPAEQVTTGVDKRVAVLPFANSGPTEHDYVADGLTEDLIDTLSVARGLRVRSRGAVMPYKGVTRDARDVGRELDVAVVVEGSVRRAPGGYRVNARLVSVADGFQLWARKFDVPEAELLAQNDVIARAIAEALTVDLEAGPRAAANAKAVDLYLRARHAYHGAFSSPRFDSVGAFEEVLALTPDDPRALAGRALAAGQTWVWPVGAKEAAFAAADRAILLAPTLGEAHAARGAVHFLCGDSVSAVPPLKRALRLAPGSAEAHETMGRLMSEVGREEAFVHLRTAIAIEPRFEFPYINYARMHALRGEHELAAEVIGSARSLGLPAAVPVASRFALWRRDVDEARLLLPQLDMRIPTHAGSVRWLRLLTDGVELPAMHPPMAPNTEVPTLLRWFWTQMEVEIAAYQGDLPRALASLRILDTEGSFDRLWLEGVPLFDELRALPEVQPIREHFAARAQRVIDAYLAPSD